MCQEPRVTMAQMRNFVLGQSIPDDSANKEPITVVNNKGKQQQVVWNPYAKKGTSSSRSATSSSGSSQGSSSSSSRTLPQATPPPPPAGLVHRSVPRPTYQPGVVPFDPSTIHEWIYPVSDAYPQRQYQVEISQSAILYNTLVSLPTGLGKTLIAAVVLYNYYRWFPTGKLLFLAPTLPLVHQQAQACSSIMGIPPHDTAFVTGHTPAAQRTCLWRQHRVFFCTPQTVQNDWEAGRCDPQQFVCLVLDEAHKATGEYAYVKVVQALQAAQAKVRIVGLSATPGTNLQAIQHVVDALHIHKIEARQDSDPSVAPYIHERQSEIVLVRQASASRDIERLLHAMVGPLLDRLRSAGARITGNATVTAYNIIKARQEFFSREHVDPSMHGYFHAAQQMVQIRSDLHRHGVGMVRTKLQRMRTETQRGMLSTLVKSDDFQKLWEEVVKSSFDPDSSSATVQDRLTNNPKLAKLREILTEHFERAKSCSLSSRAIVFSQFRDSVSEIVDVLAASEPLIRPRYFVGQGKGAQGDNAGKVKGMKQAEQHQVIREFRADVYNVLVCTCIGEEGLDIGEVDLIVNFDTLRSPIRMIQRVGRTGRKRNGRVICLVAEGPEEKTLAASRQSERNLVHALKNPKSFKVAPAEALFPADPVRRDKAMLLSQSFRMSQVEGHNGARKPRAEARSTSSNDWKLTEEQEQERLEALGQYATLRDLSHLDLYKQVRSHLLAARLLSKERLRPAKRSLGARGIALRNMEAKFPASHQSRSSQRLLLNRESEASKLFPIASTEVKAGTRRSKQAKRRTSSEQAQARSLGYDASAASERTGSPPSAACSSGPGLRTDRSGPLDVLDQRSAGATEQDSIQPNIDNSPLSDRLHEEPSRALSDRLHNDEPRVGGYENYMAEREESLEAEVALEPDDCVRREGSHDCRFESSIDDHEEPVIGVSPLEPEEFYLPTPDDSSVESSHDDISNGHKEAQVNLGEPVLREVNASHANEIPEQLPFELFQLPTQESEDSSTEEGGFQLPTQDSSSDEDSCGEDACSATRNSNDVTTGFMEHEATTSCAETRDAPFQYSPPPETPKDQGNDDDATQSQTEYSQLFVPKRKFTVTTIDDTPTGESTDNLLVDSPCSEDGRPVFPTKPPPLQSIPRPAIPQETDLMDTPESKASEADDGEEDVVCCVCFSGDSIDEDPIFLCDGPGRRETCSVAVHSTCYAMTSLPGDDEDWRCDPCLYAFTGGSLIQRCQSCGSSGGALKRMAPYEWRHVTCPSNSVNGNKRAMDSERRVSFSRLPRRKPPSKKAKYERYRSFLEDEAGVDSDDDMDGDESEEEDILAIEEEEAFVRGFIDDSTQSMTQGGHLELDRAREKALEFATPLLNRQMRAERDPWDPQFSAPGSDQGLGKMHFIRRYVGVVPKLVFQTILLTIPQRD